MRPDAASDSSVQPKEVAAGDPQMVSALAAELREYVMERWATYYPGRTSVPVITLTPRHFGFSVIFQVDLEFAAAGSERFMIKIRRQHKHGSFVRDELTERTLALSLAEFNEHVAAYGFFSGKPDGLSVVRPLDFIESHNAFVVEHAIGNDLSKLVRAGSPVVASAMRRCGLWWRMFHHELHGARDRPWEPEIIDEMIERRMVRLRKIGAPADTLDKVREEIRTASHRVRAVPVPVSLVHGDCKLRHVWATADGIQVLDFGNAKVGDSWMDPAAVVVELSLYSLWSRRMDSATKAAEMRMLLHAYFEGPPPAAFALYVVDCLLKKWHRRLRNWGSGAGLNRLRRSLKTAGLDAPLERLYIDRWFTTQIRAWLAVAGGHPPAWLQPVVK
jgi:hypothetical protein